MSGRIGNAFQADLLKHIFENLPVANIGDAGGLQPSVTAGSLYVALHTSDPGATGNAQTNEAAYPGYGRVGIARAGGSWSVSGPSPTAITNTSSVTFPICTSGGPETEVWFSVTTADSGATEILWAGPLAAGLTVNPGITPAFAASALVTTLD